MNNDEYSQLELELKHSEAELAAAAANVSSLVAEREIKIAELNNNQAIHAKQDSDMKTLKAQTHLTRSRTESLNNKIRDEEKRRSNALYDLIPFHGLFAGIISGDWKRVIPLYSQIDGLISFLTVDLAEAKKRKRKSEDEIKALRKQLKETKSAIETTKQTIAQLEADIAKSNQQVLNYDNSSKKIGQKINAIHDKRVRLETPKLKFEFFQSDVQSIMESKEGFFIDKYIADLQLQNASG